MGKKFLSLFNREFINIHSAALLLGIATFSSQILALIRDRSFAYSIGPTRALDVYYAAFRIPDLLFNSVATLVSITALLPFLLSLLSSKGHNAEEETEARTFFSQIFSVFMSFMIAVSVVLFFLMPWIAKFVAPGFSPADLHELVGVSRIMLISPILLGLSNLFQSITQLYKKFFVYALSPILYNLGIILGVYVFWPTFGVYGLGIGVIIGALLHMAIHIPVLIKSDFAPRIFWKGIDWKKIRGLFLLSLPRTLALSLNSVAIFALTSLASTLSPGAISIFTLAFNLQSVPIAIIGLSYGVAAFPLLAQYFKEGRTDTFVDTVVTTARQIVFYTLPVMVLFIVLRAHIVRIILGSGAFNWNHTRLTAASLALFTVGIIGQCFIILFVRAYYAAGKTRRPLVVNIIFTVSEIVFAYVLIHLFNGSEVFRNVVVSLLRVSNIDNAVVLMLALGYALGTILNGVALWLLFRHDFMKGRGNIITKPFLQSAFASIASGIVAYGLLTVLSPHLETTSGIGIFVQGFVAGIGGLIAWGLIHYVLKTKEFLSVARSISKKFWKQEVVGEEQ